MTSALMLCLSSTSVVLCMLDAEGNSECASKQVEKSNEAIQ